MTQSIAGTGSTTNSSQAAPQSLFGVPKYSTQPRFVLDNQNQALGFTPSGTSQIQVPTGKLDQLDIVTGIKIYMQYNATWTNTGTALVISPFFPASLIQQVTFKLQAAYNTFNLTGPLAAIIQAYRPMWGNRQSGVAYPNSFAQIGNAAGKPTFATPFHGIYAIDIPFAIKFDEYFDLDAGGNPTNRLDETIVTPMFMAAQARVVVPTITIAPALSTLDLLGAPVSRPASDTTSTVAPAVSGVELYRQAFWTANNPQANPPQYPWIYTRDYFTQPTQGQNKVGVLIQNTGVSVGQVLSLWGFVWDPSANSGLGAIVPFSSIASFELITGGSLQNKFMSAQAMQDVLQSMYGFYNSADETSLPSGIFVFDFMLSPDGAYFSNANAINTYLVNGVQVNITFNSGLIPSANATVYMGVEALKLATS
jgi:hypothetical protein